MVVMLDLTCGIGITTFLLFPIGCLGEEVAGRLLQLDGRVSGVVDFGGFSLLGLVVASEEAGGIVVVMLALTCGIGITTFLLFPTGCLGEEVAGRLLQLDGRDDVFFIFCNGFGPVPSNSSS